MKKTRVSLFFIAALFIIARTWEQHRCPSIDEWIKKFWYTHNGIYIYSIQPREVGWGRRWEGGSKGRG